MEGETADKQCGAFLSCHSRDVAKVNMSCYLVLLDLALRLKLPWRGISATVQLVGY